jgi:hypothetical protein
MTGIPRVPRLELLKSQLKRIGRTHEFVIEIADGDAANKLAWLEFKRRHFLSLSGEMPAQILRYVKAGVARAVASEDPGAIAVTMQDAADGAKALVLLRFRNGGADARPMWGLSPAYRQWKAANGYPTRIGTQTGALYTALAASRFRFVPRGGT